MNPPIDSSNMNPACWARIARAIADRYEDFDGFVVLHGTDTMAYTASVLSFMLRGISIPVVLTGAQLPMAHPLSDGMENLRTALAARTAPRTSSRRCRSPRPAPRPAHPWCRR